MNAFAHTAPLLLSAAFLPLFPLASPASDVRGYSVLKSRFFLQTDAEELILDPDFAFSLLVSVDLTEEGQLTEAAFRAPDGIRHLLDDLGDYWTFLDTHETLEALNAAYEWGDFTLEFETANEGFFACTIRFPETPLPPLPKLINFADAQAVDASRPLTLTWDFLEPPKPEDFVQVYVTLGHATVFQTPGFGQAGALDGRTRSVTVPAKTLAPGLAYGLHLEITRVASVNADCHPEAEGAAGTLSATEVDLITVAPPVLRLLSRPANGLVSIEVVAEPGAAVVLQSSEKLAQWADLATNAAPDGTNVFTVPAAAPVMQFFRARLP